LGRAALLVVLACLVVAPLARADGDPASDYLLGTQVFIPFDMKLPVGSYGPAAAPSPIENSRKKRCTVEPRPAEPLDAASVREQCG